MYIEWILLSVTSSTFQSIVQIILSALWLKYVMISSENPLQVHLYYT